MTGRLLRGDQINWNQVYYFSEIASAGSVKAAAKRLGLSPSTLSEHLAQLESDLKIKLFVRAHRKLTITPEGARLFQGAREMFENGLRFLDAISPTPLGCYPISIGLVPGPAFRFAHGIIRDFAARHRDVSANILRFDHDQIETELLEAKLDFGFTDRRTSRKDIVQVPVAESELRFFVSQSVPDLSLAELLATMPLVLCRSERKTPSAVEELLDATDLPRRNIIVSDYPSLVETLCRDGVGIAVLGSAHFENDRSVRSLTPPRDFPPLTERLFATWTKGGENSDPVRRLLPLLSA